MDAQRHAALPSRISRRTVLGYGAGLGFSGALAACTPAPPPPPPGPPRVTGAFTYGGHVLTPLEFGDLSGWVHDDHAAAIAAFARSSRLIRTSDTLAGVAAEAWRATGRAAEGLIYGSAVAARDFFEERFQPVKIEDLDRSLFTGYFEPVLEGSRVREGIYQTPLHAVPSERRSGRRKGPTRKEIFEGALDGRDLEILWVADPVEAFFLEIQGSGRIRFPDGTMTRVGYAGQNGHPYIAIGRLLVKDEIMEVADVTAESIKEWIRANPEAGRELMNGNPSYVFFRELSALDPALGPLGAMEVPLTDLRSVAVDRRVHPLGAPVWIETTLTGLPFHRLMVAQDVGGAIRGAQRADIYCGSGLRAGLLASGQAAQGRLVTLVPRDALGAWVKGGIPAPGAEGDPVAGTVDGAPDSPSSSAG